MDGQVVVLDTQPWGDVERAEQVRRNMENGTSYHYFLHFSDDTVEKICQALQVIVWTGIAGVAGAPDYKSRIETIRNNKDHVLDDLRRSLPQRLVADRIVGRHPDRLLSRSQREQPGAGEALYEIS